MVWKASETLERSTNQLCVHYGIPDLVQGSLVVAVASSLPELASALVSTLLHGDFGLGVAIVVGSAIFNVLVIPGLAGWHAPVEANRGLLYRDVQFYLISIAVLLLSFSLAVIYRPVAGEPLHGEMGRGIAALPLLLYALYIYLQLHDSSSESRSEGRPSRAGDSRAATPWLSLLISVAFVLLGAEGLVRTALGLGERFETPSFLWGVTIVAAATSAPDAVISLSAARRGRGVVSLGNVVGSNVFDLLVAVPAGVLVAGSVTVDYATVAPLMGGLTVATLFLFVLLRREMRLSRRSSRLLLGLYALFVAWMVLETAGVTHALG